MLLYNKREIIIINIFILKRLDNACSFITRDVIYSDTSATTISARYTFKIYLNNIAMFNLVTYVHTLISRKILE